MGPKTCLHMFFKFGMHAFYVKLTTLRDQLSFMEPQFTCAIDFASFETHRQKTKLVQFFYGSRCNTPIPNAEVIARYPKLMRYFLEYLRTSKIIVRSEFQLRTFEKI